MAPLGSPITWIPYVNGKDCSQGFCSLSCPQWCYIIFPPPPPSFDEFPGDVSGPTFSPLVIAIIGILVSAFLLVSYYTIISKYCGNRNNDPPLGGRESQIEEMEDNHNPSLHEPWLVSTTGLDEALIKSITMCKYKRGDGLVEGTDCPVCLSQFEEAENLRLLPKCRHAFHVSCIDTWLKSHSNCPLCRANIVFVSSSTPPLQPPPLTESITTTNAHVSVSQEERVVSEDEAVHSNGDTKIPLRSLEERDTIIEIRDERYNQHVRRSFSMDHPCQSRTSVSDILTINDDDPEDCLSGEAASSPEMSSCKSSHGRKGGFLGALSGPVAMKRSFSSGRLFLPRHGRVRDTICPI